MPVWDALTTVPSVLLSWKIVMSKHLTAIKISRGYDHILYIIIYNCYILFSLLLSLLSLLLLSLLSLHIIIIIIIVIYKYIHAMYKYMYICWSYICVSTLSVDGSCASMEACTHAAEPGQRMLTAEWSSASSARRDIRRDIGVFMVVLWWFQPDTNLFLWFYG